MDLEQVISFRFYNTFTKCIYIHILLGKRVCAGETFSRQTMFLLTAGLLQQFTFKTPKGKSSPDLVNIIWGINISSPDYWMEAIPREC